MINNKYTPCKYYSKTKTCPFGNNCSFNHSDKIKKQPCWFFNNGGCTKSERDCICEHIKVPNMRKPLHLQHPCKFWHCFTPLQCKNGNNCGGDHSYELTKDEWTIHFPKSEYPGIGYLNPKTVTFPIIKHNYKPKPVVDCVWNRNYSFKSSFIDIKNQVENLESVINNLNYLLKNNGNLKIKNNEFKNIILNILSKISEIQ